MLPSALSIGVGWDLFWHLSPKELACFGKAHEKQIIEIDEISHRIGIYVFEAHLTALQNAFRNKGERAMDYRKEPLLKQSEGQEEVLNEVEAMNGLRIMRNLEMSMAVFNLNKANRNFVEKAE